MPSSAGVVHTAEIDDVFPSGRAAFPSSWVVVTSSNNGVGPSADRRTATWRENCRLHLEGGRDRLAISLFEQTNVVSVNKRLHHRVEGRDMSCAILGRAPKEHQGSSKIPPAHNQG